MKIIGGDEAHAGLVLTRLAREQFKLKLLADIRTDMTVCEIEGWDPREYVRDLHAEIARFDPCGGAS